MAYIGNEPSVNFTSFAKQDITGDGGANYTLTYAVANANEIEVFVNNVRQEPTEAYTVSGTALTMTGNVASTDDFYVIYLGKALQTTTPPDGSVTSAKLDTNIAVSGTLDVSGAFTSQGIDDNATSTAITLDSNGNVILSSNEPTLFLKDSNNANTTRYIKNNAEIFTIGRINDDLSASSVEHLRVDDSGNLLINTTTSATDVGIELGNNGITKMKRGTLGDVMLFVNSGSGSQVGKIQIGASSTSYITTSDHRLKENVTADWDATTRLKQLNPVRFNFIADADTTVDGFLAHEVQSVVPEAISNTHNEVEVWQDGEELPDGVSVGDNKLDEDGNTIPVYQGIDQSKLVPLLVKTIQELEARITALESE